MPRWLRTAVIAATVGTALALLPANAAAAVPTYGDLDLAYEATSTNFPSPPERREQSSYHPCDAGNYAGLALLAGGGWVYDSDPMTTPFELGQAYLVTLRPRSQLPPDRPDSWHEVVDNRSTNSSLGIGEGTVCGDVSAVRYASDSAPSPGKERAAANAHCPGGTHVLGGGGRPTGPFETQRLVASAPFDDGDGNQAPDDGWRAKTDNVGDASRSLTAYAVCADVNGLSYESEPFTVNANARAEDEATCPVGQYVIGGGVSQNGVFRKQRLVMTRYDMTSHASWEVQLDNLGAQSLDATAHAICHS